MQVQALSHGHGVGVGVGVGEGGATWAGKQPRCTGAVCESWVLVAMPGSALELKYLRPRSTRARTPDVRVQAKRS